ncbi:MAG: alkaline phosphatase family protein, partial [Gammaproteobacteria bacterium]
MSDSPSTVLLLFDGLGERQVETLIGGGAIASSRTGSLRSVFPSSTAPAITSFASGLFPAAHAIPGWFCWSDELDAVVRPLPMDIRGAPDSPVDAPAFCGWQSASAGFQVPFLAIQPGFIAESAFSRHAWAGATRIGYARIDSIVAAVEDALRSAPGGAFVWVYLPQFDTVSHRKGWQSDAALAVARRFDALFGRLAERLADTDALLLATADHGFIDVPEGQRLCLEDFPEVAAHLARPLSGEPRTVYCQARDGEHPAF